MWVKAFLLLLHTVEVVVASQCWQGATFSSAVVSPVDSSGILRVPGVASLAQCISACCDLPVYELAWMFEGQCYILSCQQGAPHCQPQHRPGADSVVAFVRRAPPQTLVLQSLERDKPWRARSRSTDAPGDLEALKDLALFDDAPEKDSLDVGYSEGREGFNHSQAPEAPERGVPTESSVPQNRASSLGYEGGTKTPTDPAATQKKPTTQLGTESTSPARSLKPTTETDSRQHDHIRTSLPTAVTTPHPISLSVHTDQPLTMSLVNPVERTLATNTHGASVSPEPTTESVKMFQSATNATTRASTFDPSPTTVTMATTTTTTTTQSVPEVGGSNRGPLAVVGPDRQLILPVNSLSLDGSASSDDRGITSYHWEANSGPPGLKLDGGDRAVAIVTGLRVGRYTFKLTVSDREGETDSNTLTVRVQEARSLPPVAHASGSHSLTLPNNSLILRGSVTEGDQVELHYLWVRDRQSPAAGDVLFGSETSPSLYLTNLVEGTYLFQLRVTDAQGRVCTAMATVEVRPEPGGGEEVEIEMSVSVSQVSVSQRDTLVRQLAALLHVLETDIQVRGLQGHSHLSTVLRVCVRGLSGSRLVSLLRNQLVRERTGYLLFTVIRVDTVLCLLHCSGRGQCDPISKQCNCDPFWTENLIRRYLGDGDSNCEWRVLYVVLTSFLLMVFILSVSWTMVCCCKRRRQTKVRRKTKYTILDNMDDQERVELRPKFSIKHRSTEQNSSLMMSESELDSDPERPVRSRIRNGNPFG